MPLPNATTGRWLLVLVAVLWSTSGLFAKAPWLQQWPLELRGPLLAFWRTTFAGLCLLPLIRRPAWTWRLVPAALIFALMNLTFLTAMTRTTAANAIWLQNTGPMWVFLFNVVFLPNKVVRRDWIMVVLGMAGVGLILACEFQAARATAVTPTGVLWGVAGGVTYAAVIITVNGLRDLDSAWVMTLNHLVTSALLFPFVLRQGIWPSVPQLGWLAAFGILQMGIPYWLFARSLRNIPSHEAANLVLLEPILVPIWVYLAWRHDPSYESPAGWTLVGGGLILTGLVLRYGRPPTGRRGRHAQRP
jgi:drug/metabolite transporter (DMT)-like permease